jgi:hypothetical protein
MQSGKEPAGLTHRDFIDLTEVTDGSGSGSDDEIGGAVSGPAALIAADPEHTNDSNDGGNHDGDHDHHHDHDRVLTGRIAKPKPPAAKKKKTTTGTTKKKPTATKPPTTTTTTPAQKPKGKNGKPPACTNCRKLKARCERVTACERCLRVGHACSNAAAAAEGGGGGVFVPGGQKGKACAGCRKIQAKCVRKESCERSAEKGIECVPFEG